jgi:hypothetical protein
VVAEHLRVAERGALLLLASTSQIVESTSITSRPEPGPAPSAQARSSTLPTTASNGRTWPKVKDLRNVPSVEGAITRWGSTPAVFPARNTSA